MRHLPRKLLRVALKAIVSIIIFAAIFIPFSLPVFTLVLLGSALLIQIIAIVLDLIGLPQKAILTRYWRRKILAPIIKVGIEFLNKYGLHQAILGIYMYEKAANFYFTEGNAKTVFPQRWDNGFFFLQNTLLFTTCTATTTATTFFFITKIHKNTVKLFINSLYHNSTETVSRQNMQYHQQHFRVQRSPIRIYMPSPV